MSKEFGIVLQVETKFHVIKLETPTLANHVILYSGIIDKKKAQLL